jgi:hypothetical protein
MALVEHTNYIPAADYAVHVSNGPITIHFAIGPWTFIVAVFVLGFVEF